MSAKTDRYATSDENLRRVDAMIDEMSAAGLKVVRVEGFETLGAKLIVPARTVAESSTDHEYYPNAVRELYDKWKSMT